MTVRHLLTLTEVGPENLARLVRNALGFAERPADAPKSLRGRVVGIYFRGTSTRTRTAFTVGAIHLGAAVVAYGPNDLQIVTGETIADTARVLANYLDALVIRTNDTLAEMQALAAHDTMAIVNAMSENEHPTQAVADLATMHEAFGRLDGLHVLYLGEGNNSAAALAFAVAMTPRMRLTLMTPEGYGVPEEVLAAARGFARESGAVVEQHHRADALPTNVDVVYTTRWQTMGVPKPDPNWKQLFRPFSVTKELMARVSKPAGTVFLHDLPAVRGDDVTDEVLDGPQSLAFRQAKHKMTSAMAVLQWCLNGE
jgi:ornithine carbamoyltransferase